MMGSTVSSPFGLAWPTRSLKCQAFRLGLQVGRTQANQPTRSHFFNATKNLKNFVGFNEKLSP